VVLSLAHRRTQRSWLNELAQAAQHTRWYVTTPDGIAAVRAGTYGMSDGHQWVCTCPCHEVHAFQPSPHPDHAGRHERVSADVYDDVQQALLGQMVRVKSGSPRSAAFTSIPRPGPVGAEPRPLTDLGA
jgi:hypothetical protein